VAWQREFAGIPAGKLAFLDESAAQTNMTRRWGRALRAARVYDHAPAGHWRVTTLIGSIRLNGTTACMTIPAATDIPIFRAYVQHVLYFDTLEQKGGSNFNVRWKDSVLPKIAWPEEFLKPDFQNRREILFLFLGKRVAFPLGFFIPISPQESSSYEFVGGFSASAPFKMSPKHFSVVVRIGKKGTLADRKADPDIVARLKLALV
jgi:hypothetical protein